MNEADIQAMLYEALAQPVGLLLTSDDPTRAREAIYRARAKLADEELGRLQVRLVDLPDGQIAIVKGALMPKGQEPPVLVARNLTAADLDL